MEDLKYEDVIRGVEGYKMVLRFSGTRDACIEFIFMVFMKKDRHYPIQRTIDDVSGVAYSTGTKGWMNKRVMVQWIFKLGIIKYIHSMHRFLHFVDNCSGNSPTPEMATDSEAIRT